MLVMQLRERGRIKLGDSVCLHGGGINGFSSAIIRLPEPNVTAIVLANNESVNAFAIGRDLLAIFYGGNYTVPEISRWTSTVRELSNT